MVRVGEVQSDLVVTWARLPRSPGHAFYDKLQNFMAEAGLNAFRDALQALLPAVVSECCDGPHVGRDGVVVEEAGDHLLEPCALLADRPMHSPLQLRLPRMGCCHCRRTSRSIICYPADC